MTDMYEPSLDPYTMQYAMAYMLIFLWIKWHIEGSLLRKIRKKVNEWKDDKEYNYCEANKKKEKRKEIVNTN